MLSLLLKIESSAIFERFEERYIDLIDMINLTLNGEKKTLNTQTITQLFEYLDLKNLRFAVAINRQVIPRSEYESTFLKEGDEVEIVQAVGGG